MALTDLARQMGKEIQASEEYKNLNAAKEANDNDAELQDLIGKFNLKRIEINTAMSAEKKDEEKLAALRGDAPEELAAQIWNNAHTLFAKLKNSAEN